MKLTFSGNGKNYTATSNDIFMDNGVRVVYIQQGKHANPTASRVEVKPTEWARIKEQLSHVDYEAYYGRKPLMKGINIYQLKQA